MSTTTLQILVLITSWLSCAGKSYIRSNNILGLAIPEDSYVDLNTVCKTFPDMTNRQYELCTRYPDVTASAIQGIQIAIHECQFQFKGHRWNCSSLERKNKNPHSSPLLSRGFRETAFAYAISAAGVVSQVARACAMGKLETCGCHPHLDHKTNTWKWKGCNHNVEFGHNFARKFLDYKEKANDLHSHTNLHNNRAGRLSVMNNVKTMCKCHGMSGSCELKTCWKSAPPFREVGSILKEKYERASKVYNTNSVNGKLRKLVMRKKGRRKRRAKPDSTGLVFFEKSPNFCDVDDTGSTGTRGRYCNRSSSNMDSCENLCCGRGFDTLKIQRTERCQCRFHWCCYVVCKKCTYNDWVTVCK